MGINSRLVAGLLALWVICVKAAAADDISLVSPLSGKPVWAAPDRVLARLRPNADVADALPHIDAIAGLEAVADGRLAIVHVAPGAAPETVLSGLRAQPNVVAAEPDYVVIPADRTPNDPLWDNQCGLRRIQCPDAWEIERGRPDVTVAIVDTGVAYDHPDLIANLRRNPADPPNGIDDDGNGYVDDFRGWDFVSGDNDPHADRGDGVGHPHGTHVAGIATAVTGNRLGVAGVGWDCTFLPLRVIDETGVGYLSDVAKAIEYATDQGAVVINLSLEGPYSMAFQPAIDYAYERGVVVVAAAGNSGMEITADPATWVTPLCNDGDRLGVDNRVLGVSAVDCSNQKRLTANYGSAYHFIDLSAPGANTLSTYWPGATYQRVSGTSQAAPHVAGAAALVVSHFGRRGPDVVTSLLKRAAVDIDGLNPAYAGKLGAGRLDVNRALRSADAGPVVAAGLEVVAESPASTAVNGRAEPQEVVDLRIGLRNLGAAIARDVRCHLTSGDSRVVVKRSDVDYGDIAPGVTATPGAAFRVRVWRAVPEGTRVPLALGIASSGGGPWQDVSLSLPVGWDALGEPDDTCAEAFLIHPGDVLAREIGNPLDQDWFTFDAAAGTDYIIATRPRDGSAPDTYMSLRDAGCGRESASDDHRGVGEAARLRWVCPADGRYAVAVSADADGWTGPYELSLRSIGVGEPGPIVVTSVAVDDDTTGLSHGNGNGRAEPREVLEVHAGLVNDGPLPVTGVSAELTSPRGGVRVLTYEAVFRDMAPGQTAWSQAPFIVQIAPGMVAPAEPPLRFHVVADQGEWDSEVRFAVGRSELGEPDDACTDGMLVATDGFRHSRRFERSGDVDWFRFDAVAGVAYDLYADPDLAAHPALCIHNLDCGAPVVCDGDGVDPDGASIHWECPATGRYAASIRDANSESGVGYGFGIVPTNNVGPGEPDDVCENGVPVVPDGTARIRDFGLPGDEDWFGLDLAAGTTYVIETGPAPGAPPELPKGPPDGTPRRPDTVLELHDTGCGGLIAYDDDGGEGLFSLLAFTPTESGTYSGRVTELWGSVGAYTFSVRANTAPLVAFMGEPDYQSDVFRPDIGLADSTWFVFKAMYDDADGDEPEYVRVRLRAGGVEPPPGPITMRRATGDPLTGIGYRARRRLPAGEYECRIEASDGFAAAGGEAASWQSGPIVRGGASGALVTSLSVLPNPPRSAEVRFSVTNAGEASVRVLNIAGRELRRVATAMVVEPGLNTAVWDGTSGGGASAPPGTYLIEVRAEGADGSRDRRVAVFRW